MKTIRELNKLVKDGYFICSFYTTKVLDFKIEKFIYKDNTLFAVLDKGRFPYLNGSKSRCLNKAIEDIEIANCICYRVLYADPTGATLNLITN